MASVRNLVIFGLGWEVCVQFGDVVRHDAVATPFGCPELNRHLDWCQARRGEEAGQRVDNHRSLDPRIVREGLRGIFHVEDLLAELQMSLLTKLRCFSSPIGISADQHQSGITAARVAEKADSVLIDSCYERRRTDHEVDQALDVGRPLDENREVVGTALILRGITRVTNGYNNEAVVG